MNLKDVVLLLFCVLQPIFAFSQENFVKGYVISTNGDTIYGEIDYRNWRINPKQIQFKKTGESTASTYTPIDIKAFYAGQDFYQSGIVEAEKSSRSTINIDVNPEFILEVDTAFLRALVIGDKSLYHYVDPEDRENFYLDTKAGFELLRYKEYLITKDGLQQKQSRKLYAGQLINYFSDCPTFRKGASQIQYSKKSLLKAFDSYYACISEDDTYVKKDLKFSLNVMAVAGISRVNFTNEVLAPSTDPTIGISLNTVFPWNTRRWSLANTFLLTHLSTEGVQAETSRLGRYTRREYEEEAVSLKLHSMLRYSTMGSNFQYFFGGGIMAGYTNTLKEKIKIYTEFGPDSNTEIQEYHNAAGFPFGYVLGLGSTYQKFSLSFSYEGSIRSKSLYFLLGYRLHK